MNFTKSPGPQKKKPNKIGVIYHYEIIHIILNKTRPFIGWYNFYPRNVDFLKINGVIYYYYHQVIEILNAIELIIKKLFIYSLSHLHL